MAAQNPISIAHAVGARIRALRLDRLLTAAVLAERAGLQRSVLSRIERGDHCPTLPIVARLAVALKVEPREILSVLDGVAVQPRARRGTAPVVLPREDSLRGRE